MNQGSGVARSSTHSTQGWLRISTLASSTQYSAMNTGICTRIGRQPPSGLIFSVLYSSIIARFIFCLSLPYCSRIFIRRGVTSFMRAIDL